MDRKEAKNKVDKYGRTKFCMENNIQYVQLTQWLSGQRDFSPERMKAVEDAINKLPVE